MRPIYENDDTLQIERATITSLIGQRPLTAVKLPRRYAIDWALCTSSAHGALVHAWVECKRRYCKRSEFPTLMISLKKWQEGVELHKAGGKPFLIVVEWDDGIFFLRHDEVASPSGFANGVYVGIGGRMDRDDEEDVEPCIWIPTALFHRPTAIRP
jgi:hypothetical protein